MKMPEKINEIMLAPCGMNCMVCYLYVETRKQGRHCKGCLNDDTGKPEHCKKCKIKECSINKKISHCYKCDEFPCKMIKSLEKNYNKRYNVSLIENSVFAGKQNIEILMENEREKWLCRRCGGVISLHGKTCSECKLTYDEDENK